MMFLLLQNWSYSDQVDELQKKAPNLLKVLDTVVNMSKAQESGNDNIHQRKQRGLVSGTGVLLQTRSKFTNAAGLHNALILKRGGASEKTFRRLNDKGLTVSYKTVLRTQKKIGLDHNREAITWAHQVYVDSIKEKELAHTVGECSNEQEQAQAKEALATFQDQRHPGFKLVGDNVDIGQKARQLSKSHKNPDHHFFNHAAVKNRVSGNHLSQDQGPPQPMDPTSVLPGVEDNIKLKNELIVLTAKVIAQYIPSLQWFESHVPDRISHQYDNIANKKSEVVSRYPLTFMSMHFKT